MLQCFVLYRPNQGAAAPAALSQLYESTLYQQALSQLMETELAPALQAMHRLTRQAEHWEQQLADQATILKVGNAFAAGWLFSSCVAVRFGL